jgi:CheY-like chemotaxis protein
MLAIPDIRLLLADDDSRFRETVIELLDPHFEIIAVESGEQAIEVVESQIVSAAILDMHMHCLTGLDTLRVLREREPGLPCILMSSEVTAALESAAHDLQVFSVLRKPPTRSVLLETISGALQL